MARGELTDPWIDPDHAEQARLGPARARLMSDQSTSQGVFWRCREIVCVLFIYVYLILFIYLLLFILYLIH